MKNPPTEKKRVVILGTGFGGIYTYLSLRHYERKGLLDITLINKTNHFVFTPLIHEVATGGLSANLVVESIRRIMDPQSCFLQASAERINTKEKTVTTDQGDVMYDYLVLATGAKTRFFNIPGCEENCLQLKTLEDAIAMRSHFINVFEKAAHEKNEEKRRRMLSFVIIGGGATGVELASEMAEFFKDTFEVYYPKSTAHHEINIYLVQADADLLRPFHPKLRKKAKKILEKQGVEVLVNSKVQEIKKDCVYLEDGRCIDADNVIWAGGIKPQLPETDIELERDRYTRVLVNNTLQVPSHPNIYALGDVASFTPTGAERPLPTLAQVATQQGKHLGKELGKFISTQKPMKPFVPKLKGSMVSLGQWNALADIKGLKFSGMMAWFVWRTVYLFKFISSAKKFRIIIDWTVNIFYPRDISKN